jgi:hypothetical protein
MAETKFKADWDREYAEFLSTENSGVPADLSEVVTSRVRSDLHPSSLKVFGEISLIQFGAGLVSLLFCPQFDVSFTSGMGVMPYLMRYGEGVCMLGCGAVFTAASLLASSLLLRPEEVRVLKSHRLLQLTLLATLSLGAFLCVGAEIMVTLGLAWILGAVVGGTASLELGWTLRKLSVARGTV